MSNYCARIRLSLGSTLRVAPGGRYPISNASGASTRCSRSKPNREPRQPLKPKAPGGDVPCLFHYIHLRVLLFSTPGRCGTSRRIFFIFFRPMSCPPQLPSAEAFAKKKKKQMKKKKMQKKEKGRKKKTIKYQFIGTLPSRVPCALALFL